MAGHVVAWRTALARRAALRFVFVSLLAAGAALAIAGTAYLASLQATAVVRTAPATAVAGMATPVAMDVEIADVANLYGADVRFSFDPNVLQVQDADGHPANGVQVQLGPLLTDQGLYFTVRNAVSNTAGTVAVALTQINPAEAITGTGVLFSVVFLPVAPGDSTVHFTQVMLANSDGGSISATPQDGLVTITGGATAGTATPTRSPSPSATASPTPTASTTATASATRTRTATSSSTATATATATPSATGTPTVTASSTQTLIPGAPTYTPSGTATVTNTPSVTATPSATATATNTLPPGSTSTPTPTPSVTLSATASPSATWTAILAQTSTRTPSRTSTPSPSATVVLSATPTGSATVIYKTPTFTATATASETATATQTPIRYISYLPVIFVAEPPDSWATPTEPATPVVNPGQAPRVVATVAVPGANWVAVDPATNTIFVTSKSDQCVHVIDGQSLRESQCIAVGANPFGLAANPSNRLLYVANFGAGQGGGSVSLISMDTRQVLVTYLTGGEPTLPLVDTQRGDAFVPLHATDKVAYFNGGAYLGAFAIGAPQPFGIALDSTASPRRLYVGTRERDGRVQVLNVDVWPPRYITTLQPGGTIYNLVVNQQTGVVYVVHSDANGDNGRYLAVYSREGERLAGATDESLGVNTFDGGGLAILATSNDRLYIAGTECIAGSGGCAAYAGTGSVQVRQGETAALVYTLGQPALQSGPFGVAVDDNRKRVYVTSKGNGGWLNVIEDYEFGSP